MASPNVIVLIGVAGSGKTTVGTLLAEKLSWPFYDGDDFQPQENVARMEQGLPLTDGDRRPWLLALHNLLAGICARKSRAVVACSALKQNYRDLLTNDLEGISLVWLKGEFALIQERLQRRQGHFFGTGMLGSQFEILEEPANALVVRVDDPPEAIVGHILKGLDLRA